jgi:hypothetical protein
MKNNPDVVNYLHELAFDLMAQGCITKGDTYVSMGISTYEEAIYYFEKIGWLKKMKGKPEKWKYARRRDKNAD